MSQVNNLKDISIIVPKPVYPGPGNLQVYPRYGPTIIATVLKQHGFNVQLYDESILDKIPLEDIALNSDVIGFSAKTGSIQKVKKYISQIRTIANSENKELIIILGGEHASMAPEHSLRDLDIDYLIRGEGESSIIQLLNAIRINEVKRIKNIPGIGYKKNGKLFIHSDKGYEKSIDEYIPDLTLVNGYKTLLSNFRSTYHLTLWALFNRRLPAISFHYSRGCPYACKFCPTCSDLQGNHYRFRNTQSAVRYLQSHINYTGINRVIFEDPLGATNMKCFSELLDAIINNKIFIHGTILSRIEIYKHDYILQKMIKAGIKNISIGIESLNQFSLKDYNKKTSCDYIPDCVEKLRKYGFSVTALFVVGGDQETLDDIYAIEKFISNHYIEKWRISPLCQLPERNGLFLEPYRVFTWDMIAKYGLETSDVSTGDFVTFFPKNMKPSQLQSAIIHLNAKLSSLITIMKYMIKTNSLKKPRSIIERIACGYAQSIIKKNNRQINYIEVLEDIEKGLYKKTLNGQYILDEYKLMALYEKKRGSVGELN